MRLSARLTVAALSVAALPVLAGTASAQIFPNPVSVSRTSDGGVAVAVRQNATPVAGVQAGPSGACAGLGEDIPFCLHTGQR